MIHVTTEIKTQIQNPEMNFYYVNIVLLWIKFNLEHWTRGCSVWSLNEYDLLEGHFIG